MKKREFQKKAAAALLGKLADVVMELEENPNITITSEYHSSYFKLRKNSDFGQADRRADVSVDGYAGKHRQKSDLCTISCWR